MKRIFIGILGFLFLISYGRSNAQSGVEYYKAGVSFYQQGQYDQAVSCFQAGVQLDPNDWRSFQMLGTVFYKQKKTTEALSAIDQSLKLHPDNPVLQSFEDKIKPPTPTAQPPIETPVVTVTTQVPTAALPAIHGAESPVLERNHVFVKLINLGYAFDQYTADFSKAEDVFMTGASVSQTHTEEFKDDHTLEPVVELGFAFDPENAIALNYGTIGAGSGNYYKASFWNPNGPTTVFDGMEQTFGIHGEYFEFKYYRYLPDSWGRWYGSAGVGYGTVWVSSSYQNDAAILDARALAGNTIGFSLGIGREIPLFWILGLDLGIQARYANIPKVSDGTYTLVTANGAIGLINESAVGGSLKYQSMDFSGIKGTAGVNLYF